MADAANIEKSIAEYFSNKYKKNSTIKFVSDYTIYEREYVRENFKPGKEFWNEVLEKISREMAGHISDRTVKEHILSVTNEYPVIRYTKIIDKGSGKIRSLGLETVLFRLYECVASDAAKPLWKAKFGTYQVASIKGKGQNYGKKAVKKWISSDAEGTKYMAKSDIRQCYPSISHDKIRYLLNRDLRKSNELLYLFFTFFDLYEEWPDPDNTDPNYGILIGSPASKDLCNYFLSYAYHYASEKLVKVVSRRSRESVKRLVSHVIFYADDIVFYSGNKKDIHTALKKFIQYMKEILRLDIKPNWVVTKVMYEDHKGNVHGNLLEYMGFRFHNGTVERKDYYGGTVKHRRTWVTIRRRIFLTSRRKRKKFSDLLRKKIQVSCSFAQSIVSQYGWFKNTNMVQYRKRNRVDELIRIARRIISHYAKGKPYNAQKYYKSWRKHYA